MDSSITRQVQQDKSQDASKQTPLTAPKPDQPKNPQELVAKEMPSIGFLSIAGRRGGDINSISERDWEAVYDEFAGDNGVLDDCPPLKIFVEDLDGSNRGLLKVHKGYSEVEELKKKYGINIDFRSSSRFVTKRQFIAPFEKLDVNKDGKLTWKEAKAIFTPENNSIVKKEDVQIVTRNDPDHPGDYGPSENSPPSKNTLLDPLEKELHASLFWPFERDEFEKLTRNVINLPIGFKRLDTNSDSIIDQTEWSKAKEWADVDGDGNLNKEEWQNFCDQFRISDAIRKKFPSGVTVLQFFEIFDTYASSIFNDGDPFKDDNYFDKGIPALGIFGVENFDNEDLKQRSLDTLFEIE
jgi:hypothetical protein